MPFSKQSLFDGLLEEAPATPPAFPAGHAEGCGCSGCCAARDAESTHAHNLPLNLLPLLEAGLDWEAIAAEFQTPDAIVPGDEPQFNGDNSTLRFVSSTGNQGIDGLLSPRAWNETTISYSNPSSPFQYQSGYDSDGNGNNISAIFEGFAQFTTAQMNAIHYALNDGNAGTLGAASNAFSVEAFTNLNIDYAGANGAGTIRVAASSDAGTAYAYYPSNSIYGGDSFFGPNTLSPTPQAGNYQWLTAIHEMGHSLGLKHGHETNQFGPMPSNIDSMEFSVMTYRGFINAPITGYRNEQWGYAQTWMMYDIAALQFMYGADFTVNSGNTVYSWSPFSGDTRIDGQVAIDAGGNRIFATIWDGGGIDTYDLSAYTGGVEIDLTPGAHSTFSDSQLAALQAPGFGNAIYARGNIFNALQYQNDVRSLIENAIGGSGNDVLVGNAANNVLQGNLGNDTLDGGDGTGDVALYAGVQSQYNFNGNATSATVSGIEGTDTLTGIEILRFADGDVILGGGGGGDDFSADVNTTGTVSVNGSATGVIEVADDRDWFAVGLLGGETYTIDLRGDDTGGGSLDDTYLRGIHDSTGALIPNTTDDDSGAGTDSRVTFTPATTGVYYIAAGAFGGLTGSYTLEVSGPTTAPVIVLNDVGAIIGTSDTLAGAMPQAVANGTVVITGLYTSGPETVTVPVSGLNIGFDQGVVGPTFQLAPGVVSLILTGDADADVFDLGSDVTSEIIIGNNGNNTIDGWTGDDVLVGGGGNDDILGFDGADVIVGDAGNDTLSGESGSDNMAGGAGNDLMFGGIGNDFMDGGADNDTLEGGDNDDVIEGGLGADSMDGGAGTDWLVYTDSAAGVDINLTANLVSSYGPGGDAVGDTIANFEAVNGSDFFDGITGTSGVNLLLGNGGIDTLAGEGGDDILAGGDDGDLLLGGAGSDILFGEGGADTFRFSFGDQIDVVVDFVQGLDALQFSGTGLFDVSQLNISNDGGDLVIGYGTDTVLLLGQAGVNLTNADVSFI